MTLRFTEIVKLNGEPVGVTAPLNDFEVEAVLWRPEAESDKRIGLYKSRRKARAAVIAAAAAR